MKLKFLPERYLIANSGSLCMQTTHTIRIHLQIVGHYFHDFGCEHYQMSTCKECLHLLFGLLELFEIIKTDFFRHFLRNIPMSSQVLFSLQNKKKLEKSFCFKGFKLLRNVTHVCTSFDSQSNVLCILHNDNKTIASC